MQTTANYYFNQGLERVTCEMQFGCYIEQHTKYKCAYMYSLRNRHVHVLLTSNASRAFPDVVRLLL